MRAFLELATARALSLVVSTACALAVTALLVRYQGAQAFGSFSLIVSILALFPFLDLGLSAVLTNAAAGGRGPALDDLIATTSRIMYFTGGGLIVVSLTAWAVGVWEVALSSPSGSSTPAAAGISVAILGLCLPFSQSQAILTGLGRIQVTILAAAVRPLIVLALTWLVVISDGPALVYLSASAIGMLASSVIQARWLEARESVQVPAPPMVIVDRNRRLDRGQRQSAGAMIIITAALPAVFATDQIILSHAARDALPEYALVNQFYQPCWAIVTAAGMALWARFARERSLGATSTAPLPFLILGFGAAGLVLATAMVGGVLILGSQLAGGEISVSVSVLVAFTSLLVAQSVCLPMGMFLTNPAGLSFQAWILVAMALLNIPLSVIAASRMGAAGPAAVSGALVLLVQFPAYIWGASLRKNGDWSIS